MMKELIFGKSENGKADKMITNEISASQKRCSVEIYEVPPEYEIGEVVPNDYDFDSLEPSVVLRFHSKKSMISLIAALRDSLDMWNRAEIDAEINNLKRFREEIQGR